MLQLVKPNIQHKDRFESYLDSFWDVLRVDWSWIYDWVYKWYNEYLERIGNQEKGIWVNVAASTYYLFDGDILVWVTNIRHNLNDFLLKEWGHIWYSIHPAHRWKWYGKEILRLWLVKLTELWVEKVLVTCDYGNIWSEKVILSNWWIYENTLDWTKRFWIENTK
jgi:predicted acetyltransferase